MQEPLQSNLLKPSPAKNPDYGAFTKITELPSSYFGDMSQKRLTNDYLVQSNKANQRYYNHTSKIAEYQSPERKRHHEMQRDLSQHLRTQIEDKERNTRRWLQEELQLGRQMIDNQMNEML